MRIPRYVRFLPWDLRYAMLHLWLNVIAGSPLVPRGARVLLYRFAGLRVGRANIFPGVRFLNLAPVTIETNAMLNAGVVLENRAPITIRARAHLGPSVLLGTSTHELGHSEQRASATAISAPIEIQQGAWVGARSVILPGVTVGAGAVIAAGSVVLEDCKPDTLYAGVPATAKRSLRAGPAS